jgi:hypothetical protein
VVEAIARSLNDLGPANKALPVDVSLDWSRQYCERKEAEQQRHLLDLAAPTAAPTAPVAPVPLIKLEERINDEFYRSSPPRGDPGQGSNRWYEAPPPEDAGNSSDDDDDGDYTAFYCHFGM